MRNILLILAFSLVFGAPASAKNAITKDITVYKNPECLCCNKWIKYLKQNNYNVTEINTRNVPAEKNRLGVPEKLAACHTAVINGYVVEGHATHRDIKRLLLLRQDVTGIAIPGMPIGSPGMEQGNTKEKYDVITFDKKTGKKKIFVKH